MAAPFTSPLAEAIAPDVLDRFLRYVRVDTQSARVNAGDSRARRVSSSSVGCWSDELRAARARATPSIDENGYVIATLPANDGAGAAGDRPDRAHGHEPRRARRRRGADSSIEDYDGGVIELPQQRHQAGSRGDARARRASSGHDIVTSAATRCSAPTTRRAWRRSWPPSPTSRASRAAAPDAADRLHPRRGDRRGGDAVRHRAVRRAVRLHARRLRARRAAGRDVLGASRRVVVHGRRRPSRSWRPASSSARCGWRRRSSRRLPSDRLTPETTSGREGFIHPYSS